MQSVSVYYAAAYVRASKDDAGSETIGNQIELIRSYVTSMPEINIVAIRSDNGYSGIDLLRPSFNEMMKDIETGKLNCVIVKDLSRLGRNYIEVGELIDTIFPRYNVRLIAVNDHFDSLNPRSEADEILIPFKNLINEQYLRDFSIKIRSNLNVKRKNGDFVAPFAPYGYRRDERNRHRLVIDEHAAEIVRTIFHQKIDGMGQQRIAEWLEKIGEPAPAEYKRRSTNYSAPFQRHLRASWSAVAVGRILRNPVYTGTLIQGKSTSPNYKIKKRAVKPAEEWDIIPNNHEAIISDHEFEIVNSLLLLDTRTSPGKDKVYPLSGILFCRDCGNNMVRKKAGKYIYYVCATNKSGKGCSSHHMNQLQFDSLILEVLKTQISYMADTDKCLDYLQTLPYKQQHITKLNRQIADREQELISCDKYKRSLYEDYAEGVITKEDYIGFGEEYSQRIVDLRQAIEALRLETELLHADNSSAHPLIRHFERYRNIPELSRKLTVSLIERIDIYKNRRIDIRFRHHDKFLITQAIPENFAIRE